ncbi:hypothetical protein QJS10_CPB20g00610 [Acorus calamus]|uniref:Uncharacterized protein n=1 Tax=Acorus calamus TaxID=4465 RepID=A0AAV9CDE6_ACOCL|nr:hypothetical protein QJS10_CPB20g00610 [Acorus calamus]
MGLLGLQRPLRRDSVGDRQPDLPHPPRPRLQLPLRGDPPVGRESRGAQPRLPLREPLVGSDPTGGLSPAPEPRLARPERQPTLRTDPQQPHWIGKPRNSPPFRESISRGGPGVGRVASEASGAPIMVEFDLGSDTEPPRTARALELIDLSTNNLTGAIPESLCDSGVLSKLILFSNSLNGPIPRQLGQCASLRRVRLEQNRLSGELPPGLTELRRVYYLDISDNHLSGRIDGLRWSMRSLQDTQFRPEWVLRGLAESFGGENLEAIDGSGNSLSGTIPGGFGRLSHLVRLNLSHNSLSGPVPRELGQLKSLDLSQNAGLCCRSGNAGASSLPWIQVSTNFDLRICHDSLAFGSCCAALRWVAAAEGVSDDRIQGRGLGIEGVRWAGNGGD